MSRVYNFSAGPAVLPEPVLKELAEEMMDYQGCGMSVMEMSHRSPEFQKIIDEAEQDLRDLMNIPDNYKVLFLQGGASQQFAMIPMNLMKNGVADYIVTGQWAKKAYQEAQKYGKVNKIASSEDKTFSYIPDCSDLDISPDADYVYICENNTIYGTKFKTLPNTKGKTLVAGREGILVTPHLGASTEESEENCAEMAVKELRNFLENGNIKNSVNFPNCDMGICVAVGRIAICHKNIPNMISQFTKILGGEGVNIADMTNKSKGEYAYTLIDLESTVSREALEELRAVEGVSKVRVVK